MVHFFSLYSNYQKYVIKIKENTQEYKIPWAGKYLPSAKWYSAYLLHISLFNPLNNFITDEEIEH